MRRGWRQKDMALWNDTFLRPKPHQYQSDKEGTGERSNTSHWQNCGSDSTQSSTVKDRRKVSHGRVRSVTRSATEESAPDPNANIGISATTVEATTPSRPAPRKTSLHFPRKCWIWVRLATHKSLIIHITYHISSPWSTTRQQLAARVNRPVHLPMSYHSLYTCFVLSEMTLWVIESWFSFIIDIVWNEPEWNGNIKESTYRYTGDLLQLEQCCNENRLPLACTTIISPLYKKASEWSQCLVSHPDAAFAAYVTTGITNGFRISLSKNLTFLRVKKTLLHHAARYP